MSERIASCLWICKAGKLQAQAMVCNTHLKSNETATRETPLANPNGRRRRSLSKSRATWTSACDRAVLFRPRARSASPFGQQR